MGIDFSLVLANPLLVVALALIMLIIVLNGMTDAANAIATVISTRCMPVGAAMAMAAACNFLGLLVMTLLGSVAVAGTIMKMVNFGTDAHAALVGLSASMIAIMVWGLSCWRLGIPTSQSHALIAGLTGSAIAIAGGMDGVNVSEWMKVIYGLVFSAVAGFAFGWIIAKVFQKAFAQVERSRAETFFAGAQIASAAALAFVHGAQDGQKFLGIALTALALAGLTSADTMAMPLWLIVLCSGMMGLGTVIGGKRIIKTVAMEMTHLEKYQGFSASLAAALGILISTILGMPVSTTHTKTTAIMGVAASKRLSSVKWGTAKNMVITWIITFPGCGIMGFVFAKVFALIF